MNNIRSRWIEPRLASALAVMPVVVVTGTRQAGKTTIVRELKMAKGRTYHTLDDLNVLGVAQNSPQSLLSQTPVTIDEVQRAPNLLLAVKSLVDRHQKPGEIVLTGSANLLLMSRVSESLAGRALYIELHPFCPSEWVGKPILHHIDNLFDKDFAPSDWPKEKGHWQHWLLRGGFPRVLSLSRQEERDIWFTGYVQAYLERDLRDLAHVASLPDYQKLMRLAALRTGRIINQSDLARETGLPQPTAHRYLNLLETGFQIARLHCYSGNQNSSLVKGKKLFFTDCGLAAWLAGIQNEQVLANRPDAGFWFEQAAYQTLSIWASLDPVRRKVYYWRDRAGREVDFVLEKDGVLVAIECKASLGAGPEDTGGIKTFSASFKSSSSILRRSIVLHCGTNAHPLAENIFALPSGFLFPK